jgi:hypothetical protein
MTFLDQAVNIFFSGAGGLDFLGTIFAIPVIVAIFLTLSHPFDV